MFNVFKKMFEEVAEQSLFHKFTINEKGRGKWNDSNMANKEHLLNLGIDLDDFDIKRMKVLTKHNNYVGTFYKKDDKYICIEIGKDYADDILYFKYTVKKLLNDDENNDNDVNIDSLDLDSSSDKFESKKDMTKLDENNEYNDDTFWKNALNQQTDNKNAYDSFDWESYLKKDDDEDIKQEEKPREHKFPNSPIMPNKDVGQQKVKEEDKKNMNNLKESLYNQIIDLIKNYEKMFGTFEIKDKKK